MDRHQSQVLRLFNVLAFFTCKADPDGVDLWFTQSRVRQRHSKKHKDLFATANTVRYSGKTDIRLTLGLILESYKSRLSKYPNTVRPLSIYVLTDGLWEAGNDAASLITEMTAAMTQLQVPGGKIGIQFVRFGKDMEAAMRLSHLDNLGKQKDVGL